ncbi:MAG: hypothetical protein C0404_05885 [Verrucomicrobia bacterium]|nr:hypothetical protein [Verrucomicrobiota bacterium]
MKTPQTLVFRMIVALFLMIGFYILALGIAGGLLYIPYAEWKYADRIHIKILLGCVISAGIILWSIFPRMDRFVAPGPVLTGDKNPKLFDMISGVADATKQGMPLEVYAVADLNAWVTERGGFMGIGSKRVMGIGLPLMQMLTVPQLRAVIAHEFGHYHGGDTKLGPWIYKTRESIIRTVQNLGASDSIMHLPFKWYGMGFLRITQAVSRHQEYQADALAAQVAGARVAGEALKAVHTAGVGFNSYWANEVVPVLSAGYRPPLAHGFSLFMSESKIASAVSDVIGKEMTEGKSDPYDTHPSLKERLEALSMQPQGPDAQDSTLAISLLGDDLPRIEHEMLLAIAGGQLEKDLEPVSWDDVGDKVLVPMWAKAVKGKRKFLSGVTPGMFGGIAKNPADLLRKFRTSEHDNYSEEEVTNSMFGTIGASLALALHARGWKFSAKPGEDIVFRSDGPIAIRPFEIIRNIAAGKTTVEDWLGQCRDVGIADLDLGTVGQKAAGGDEK